MMISVSTFASTPSIQSNLAQEKLEKIEKIFDGKIGVYAINTNNHQIIAYHANELFPVQSTSKLIAVAALLKQSDADKNILQEKIYYTKNDLVFWHPVTGKFVTTGMTLEALSEATISYSDNTAMNLIMKKLGGPDKITDFSRSIGNNSLNLEHYEPAFNSDPKNKDDTATPKDMAISVQKLTLDNILTVSQKVQLITWMRNNTSYKRIRAGAQKGWVVADKTGSGEYGIANDIGILWSPLCKPVVLAIYTIRNKKNAVAREDVVASITSIVMEEFAKNSPCFKALEK